MKVYALEIIDYARRFDGLPYVMGAEADPNSDDLPAALDCSELVQVSVNHCGLDMPDGHWMQWRYCYAAGQMISVDDAINTPGALLFVYDGTTNGHVAFSLGDGMTFEARGHAWGVGSWPVADRGWTHGALIPGAVYLKENIMDLSDETIAKLADAMAGAVVDKLMAHEIELADGKTYPLVNVLGFQNNIGNHEVALLEQIAAR